MSFMPTSPVLLGVNIDHAATLRQARYRDRSATCGGPVEPDPVMVALLAEQAGADGITVHLREDRRHIQPEDVHRLRASIRTRLNLEMACTPEMLAFALKVRPDSCCLVPESREEVTTEGGLEVAGAFERVRPVVHELRAAGIETSLFIDPDPRQIEASAKAGSPWIELHTGAWANAWHGPLRGDEFRRLLDGAELALKCGLVVNAGHGINYVNAPDIARLPGLHEVNIGHSILSRAIFTGISEAVREMKRLVQP
jgi:pyridoxine 5-phosphate synthase